MHTHRLIFTPPLPTLPPQVSAELAAEQGGLPGFQKSGKAPLPDSQKGGGRRASDPGQGDRGGACGGLECV